jgi:hypothetical protein
MIHGTESAYVYHKCRCDLCRTNHSAVARERRKLQAYGRYETVFVDAAPVREHLLQLNAQGWGAMTIAERAGTPRTVTRQLLYGRSPSEQKDGAYPKPKYLQRVRRETAEKLLKLHYNPAESPNGVLVDSTGVKRRIQALAVAGFSLRWQSQQLGWIVGNYSSLLKQDFVDAKTYKMVRDLYEKYEMRKPEPTNRWEVGGATRSIKQAKAKGWLPAAAWDDIDTDETPTNTKSEFIVDVVVLSELMDGRLVPMRHGEKKLYAKAMLEAGAKRSFVQELLRMSTTTLNTLLEEITNE